VDTCDMCLACPEISGAIAESPLPIMVSMLSDDYVSSPMTRAIANVPWQ
jgi:hypothetical protein